MRRRASGPFQLQADGSFRVNLPPDVRELLVHLFGELRDVLTQGNTSDPALRRLFPVAYHDDAERDAEYQDLMRSELVASRLTAISRVTEAIGGGDRLEPGDMDLLLQSLNAVRLLLGTMLNVSEADETESGTDDPDDPVAAQAHLYSYLGWLLEAAVGAAIAAVPDGGNPPKLR
ncbi:MAG: DUF2017 family protein [Actinobacteria bacterium]|nr:DUF2017 family protein [Actinomycetota bacterium]